MTTTCLYEWTHCILQTSWAEVKQTGYFWEESIWKDNGKEGHT